MVQFDPTPDGLWHCDRVVCRERRELVGDGDDGIDLVDLGQLEVGFDLFGVTGGDLVVEVFDLAGRRVQTVLTDQAVSGPYAPAWNGEDEAGQLVPPGLYLIRVKVDVDEGTIIRVQPLAVAY